CETRNCAAISLVECPASRRARTACRSSILSILLWPPLHENVGGRPKRRLQMPQDATEFREDRRQSLENPHHRVGVRRAPRGARAHCEPVHVLLDTCSCI